MVSSDFKYMTNAKEFYDKKIQPEYGRVKGVRSTEITRLEDKLGVKFPLAFVEYLLWMGHDNPIYAGSDAFYHHIHRNGEYLEELLEDNDIIYNHPSTPVVSLMHQGYIATWFYCDKDIEDPICYGYSESEDEYPNCKNKTFSDLVVDNVKNFITSN